MTIKRFLILFLNIVLLSGCSMQLVSPFDPSTIDQTYALEKRIDLFYQGAEWMPVEERQYAKFKGQYLDISVDIRALLRRQERRENNQETIKQVQILAQLWQQDRLQHEKTNTISNFIIKRRIEQYQRLFTALVQGEVAKDMG